MNVIIYLLKYHFIVILLILTINNIGEKINIQIVWNDLILIWQ